MHGKIEVKAYGKLFLQVWSEEGTMKVTEGLGECLDREARAAQSKNTVELQRRCLNSDSWIFGGAWK